MTSFKNFQFGKSFEIGSYQVNPQGTLRVKDLADLFQEIAWRHADSADFGQVLKESGQMWVLSRLEIKCEKLPNWGDRVQIFTAGRGVEGLFAFREFLMIDDNDKTLASGMSSWLLLSSDTKKIVKPESVLPTDIFQMQTKPDWVPKRHRLQTFGHPFSKVIVQASDLDLQNHVNNTSYIRWVEDLIFQANISIQFLSINYLAECFLGDEVDLYTEHSDDDFCVLGQVGEKKVFFAIAKH